MSEREEIRNATLEEAAHLCDQMAGEMFNDSKTFHFCAGEIRKLKTDAQVLKEAVS